MTLIDSPNMLQYIDVLLKHGSYTKAAKDLYISQPYLTQTIKKIEQELGTDIINRNTSPLQLTEAGKVYYHYLESLEFESANLRKKLSRYSAADHTIIRIGILSSLGTFLLPLFIPKFLHGHQNINITIDEDLPERNEHKVLNGELDFYIGQNPETISPNLTVHECGKQSYYAVIPESSALYQKNRLFLEPRTIPLKELLNQPLILTASGSAIRRQIDHLLRKYNIKPRIIMESSNIYTVAELAKKDLGIAVVPECVIMPSKQCRYNLYPISNELLSLNYFIAYSADKTLTSAGKSLIAGFLEMVQLNIKQKSLKIMNALDQTIIS